jgi:hypothetical protein
VVEHHKDGCHPAEMVDSGNVGHIAAHLGAIGQAGGHRRHTSAIGNNDP